MTKKAQYSMNKHHAEGECNAAIRLVKALLAKGALLSVNDGEEWVVKKSDKEYTILEALGSTGEDQIKARNANGDCLGVFYLVWGNAADGSELIADTLDNEFCEKICAELESFYAEA